MKKLNEAVSIIVILSMLLAIAPAFAGSPAPPPTKNYNANSMWVEPDETFNTATTNVGFSFNVTVYANITSTTGASNAIGGWQVKLFYDNTQLNATGCWPAEGTTSGQSQFFQSITVVTVTPSFGSNYVLDGEAWKSGALQHPPDMGGLCIIQFTIIKAPAKYSSLTSAIDLDFQWPSKTYVLDYDSSSDILNTCNDATYTYNWQQPPFPSIVVTPPSQSFGPFTIVNGTPCSVNIAMNGVSAAWGIINATLNMTYASAPQANAVNITSVVMNTAAWNVTASATYDNVLDTLDIYVETNTYLTTPLSGNVPIATVNFVIVKQPVSPAPANVVTITNTTTPIVWADPVALTGNVGFTGATITILAYISSPLPWLQLSPSSPTFGPAPVLGSTFDEYVYIMNLTNTWNLVGLQYRITFNSTILGVVNVAEGPYIPSFPQAPNVPANATWFYGAVADGPWGPNVLVGELLLPSDTTPIWPGPFPGGVPPATQNGIIADITFKILKQPNTGFNLTTLLKFVPSYDLLIDVNGNTIPMLPPQNATVTIQGVLEAPPGSQNGRIIDLFGGAVNDGYGHVVDWLPLYPSADPLGGSYPAFPAPYGGQGPMTFGSGQWTSGWMDVVFPQSLVFLNAYVTYNYWPVQSKDVGFEIEGPFCHVNNTGNIATDYTPMNSYQIWAKLTATTDSQGVASLAFRMPWPCLNPDSITGVWKVTATVTVADQVVTDIMLFYYNRLLTITKVTTDKVCPNIYAHGDTVTVTVTYEYHGVQNYPALFAITLLDNLSVPFGFATWNTTDVPILVGGATFCQWSIKSFSVKILIPKWAYAGDFTVMVTVYDKDPTLGGEALTPATVLFDVAQIGPW
jgi:hypothetical protein